MRHRFAPLALAALSGVWLFDLLKREIGLISLALAVLWLVFGGRAFSRRRVALVLFACPLFTVPARAVVETTVAFARGTARVASTSRGRPSPEAANLDRARRVFPKGGTCSGTWSGLGVAELERSTLDSLLRWFGPMRGAYLGPYPDEATSVTALATGGSPLDAAAWQRGSFSVGGRPVTLPAEARARVGTAGAEPMRAAILHGRVLAVGTRTGTVSRVHLFDLDGFGWFATYRRESPSPAL